MKRIQSKLHKIGTYKICKISLSCFNDEKYIFDNGINTWAYFYKELIILTKNKIFNFIRKHFLIFLVLFLLFLFHLF